MHVKGHEQMTRVIRQARHLTVIIFSTLVFEKYAEIEVVNFKRFFSPFCVAALFRPKQKLTLNETHMVKYGRWERKKLRKNIEKILNLKFQVFGKWGQSVETI